MNEAPGIVWFRNDLRLTDHRPLTTALQKHRKVVLVYIFDERWWQKDSYGFVRTGSYRGRFLVESVEALQAAVRDRGGELNIAHGIPEVVIPELLQTVQAAAVYAHRAPGTEEAQVEQALSKQVPLHLFDGNFLYLPEDIPFAIADLPPVFTTFRKALEQHGRVCQPLDAPDDCSTSIRMARADFDMYSLVQPKPADARSAFPYGGGEQAAMERVNEYTWQTGQIRHYKETRNGMIGTAYSSKLSPWLANGSISPRSIYQHIRKYEEEAGKNDSTYWLVFELIWRDFFRYIALKHGRHLFSQSGIKDRPPADWSHDREKFDLWRCGRTDDDFVNANMLELLHTGYMSNRGRQNAASYLAHNLQVDWRMGAAWFESLLIDYDVSSNYGNWMYVANVGNDPRNRTFDTQWQAERYDPDGLYRQLWLGSE
jgi:deoxyribodipyrimidine photo-lyase